MYVMKPTKRMAQHITHWTKMPKGLTAFYVVKESYVPSPEVNFFTGTNMEPKHSEETAHAPKPSMALIFAGLAVSRQRAILRRVDTRMRTAGC